jgi:hypothetical protein
VVSMDFSDTWIKYNTDSVVALSDRENRHDMWPWVGSTSIWRVFRRRKCHSNLLDLAGFKTQCLCSL